MTTPEEGLGVITERYGQHARHRALHAKGVHCIATFTANERASELSRAGHFSGEPVPVFTRFSNGGGDPTVPDYDPDVRGLAVSFQLPDGSRTDILSQTFVAVRLQGPGGVLRGGQGERALAVWRSPAYRGC